MTDNQSNSYQDILDKYAESISSKENSEIPQEKIIPEPELEPMTPPEPILTSEEETLLKSQPEEVFNPPQIEAPPVTEAITSPDIPKAIISPPPQIELPLEPPEPLSKKENHFFKYLFFFSLIIFIIVLVLVIISFLNSQKPISNSRDIPNNNISPTSLPVTFCEINDQKHAVGTTFPANDSCNTCICGEDLTINCTTKTCDATPSVKLSPTKSATSSAINKDLKTYTSSLYGFSFQYPSNTKVTGDINSHIFSFSIDSKVISVLISSNPEKLDVSDFFLKQISSTNPDSIKDYVKFSSVKYNGNTFTIATQDSIYFKQQSGALNHYLISSKNYVIDFGYSNAGEITNQILSTFKFL